MFDKLTLRLYRAAWWVRKKWDEQRKLTASQSAELQGYYKTAMNIFDQLGIDVNAKPADVRRLYFMMLLYLDDEEVVCPSSARTASLMAFLDTTGTGWALPPASRPVTPKFARDIDGYFAMEIFRNYRGLKDIRTELVNAINARSAQIKAMQ